MKKRITLAFSLMATTIVFGQVGINTTTPQATLDVVGKKRTTDKDGLIVPRLTTDGCSGQAEFNDSF